MEVEQLRRSRINIIPFSDRGKRPLNEDRLFFQNEGPSRALLIVADGMGGYENGDKAAEIALTVISGKIMESSDMSVTEKIELSFLKAHNAINKELENAGTTLGGILIDKEEIYVFLVGDVKIILLNGNDRFISKEHNLLNLLRDSEITIKPEEVKRLTNTVVKSLGGKSNSYSPEIVKFPKKNKLAGIIHTDGLNQFYSSDDLITFIEAAEINKAKDFFSADEFQEADDNVSGLVFFF